MHAGNVGAVALGSKAEQDERVPVPEPRRPTRGARELGQKAYGEIKKQILTCRLAPGEPFVASQFADLCGMSRTPVHEALSLLAKEGLVQVISRVGYFVAPITVGDVREVFQLRVQLESFAVQLASQRVTDADLKLFDETNARITERATRLSAEDPDILQRSLEANREFHMMIAALAGNGRLAEMIRGLLDQSDRMLSYDPLLRSRPVFMGPMHRRVFECLVARDGSEASNVMGSHIRESQQRVLSVLLGSSQ